MKDKILACWIRGKAVDLKNCKTDEHGLAVHEAMLRHANHAEVAATRITPPESC
jgi:hypothetical protein